MKEIDWDKIRENYNTEKRLENEIKRLKEENEQLRTENRELLHKTQWISTHNKLPENTKPVLVYTDNDKVTIASYFPTDKFWTDKHGDSVNWVIFWMPLPDRPEKQEWWI